MSNEAQATAASRSLQTGETKMKIRIENNAGIDTIETDDFVGASWNDVYGYVQQILDMNGTLDSFASPEGSDDWDGKAWLEYADSL